MDAVPETGGGLNVDITALVNKAAERDLSDPSALGDYFEIVRLQETENFTEAHQRNKEIRRILSVLSFIIAIQNLDENRQQSAHNDVQAANAKQEQHLLQEIKKMFEEQNQMLEDQNRMLEKILDLVRN